MQAPTTTEGGLDGRGPQARPCPGCGAENDPAATFCWRCYRAFGPVPTPSAWPPPPGATWPAAPDALGGVRTARPSLGPLALALAVTIVVASIGFVTLRGRPVSLPETFSGLARSSDPALDAATASFRTRSEAEGLDSDMAFYGEGPLPVAALAWIRAAGGAPGDAPAAFEGFAEGFASSSTGAVMSGGRVERTVEGVVYVCAPVVGAVPAGLCMWQDDDLFWVLVDVRPGTTIDASTRLAVAAHDAAS